MTTTLMTYAGPVDGHAPVTRTGGVPLVPAGSTWPLCAECSGPMQFLAQLLVEATDDRGAGAAEGAGHVLAVFMCQNDPGLCDEWDPAGGGNRVLVLPREGLAPAPVPPEGETLLSETCGIDRTVVDAASYDGARDDWSRVHDRPRRDVLGQLGGVPLWLQHDETPECPSCDQPMGFVAQFEEGRDERTAMNFGGNGCGYVFACAPCGEGSFLWQC